MKRKAVVPRKQATRDVKEAIAWYRAEEAETAALGFIDAVEEAYERIADHPGAGSPRYAHELNLPGLRCLHLRRYPWLVFYVERDGHIDVWRVLHERRHIPESLQPFHD